MEQARWLSEEAIATQLLTAVRQFCKELPKLPAEVLARDDMRCFFRSWSSDPGNGDRSDGSTSSGATCMAPSSMLGSASAVRSALSGVDGSGDDASQPPPVPPHCATPAVPARMASRRVSANQANISAPSLPSSDDSLLGLSMQLGGGSADGESDGVAQYRAIADYCATGTDLLLSKGALVHCVEANCSGWWLVSSAGKQGWVPGTFLEPVASQSQHASPVDDAETPEVVRCVSLCACEAHDQDEVSYEQGQHIDVIKVDSSGWWTVRVDGKVGVTPAINLQPLDVEHNKFSTLLNLQLQHALFHGRPAPPRPGKPTDSTNNSPATEEVKEMTGGRSKLNYVQLDLAAPKTLPGGQQQSRFVIQDDSSSERTTYSQIIFPNQQTAQASKQHTYVNVMPAMYQNNYENFRVLGVHPPVQEAPDPSSLIKRNKPLPNLPERLDKLNITGNHSDTQTLPLPIVAKAKFVSEREGVLSFNGGDTAILLDKTNPNGWWCVQIGSSIGWVPKDYWSISLCEDAESEDTHRATQNKQACVSGLKRTEAMKTPDGGMANVGRIRSTEGHSPPCASHDEIGSDKSDDVHRVTHNKQVCVSGLKRTEALKTPSGGMPNLGRNRPFESARKNDASEIKSTAKQTNSKDLAMTAGTRPAMALPGKEEVAPSTTGHGSSQPIPPHADWFFGKLGRDECETLMSHNKGQPGDFLVRESTTRNGDFVLSVLDNKCKVHHFPFTMQDGFYHLGANFETIEQAVGHYKFNTLSGMDCQVRLVNPMRCKKERSKFFCMTTHN
ncbi:PREDICTED: uncharacterized protein LOC106807200 isoform X2 [Priapulus caudatus]|nr:PREDICTED: uncharacterized protein LOC106807200 isoform X2 [Priapulus caudatus]XP_014664970.1 PREDICTED: uncharacterized protein LOC106807200 isoform X2 [Priapulus caudatus]